MIRLEKFELLGMNSYERNSYENQGGGPAPLRATEGGSVVINGTIHHYYKDKRNGHNSVVYYWQSN